MELNHIQPTLFERVEIRFWITGLRAVDLVRFIHQESARLPFNMLTAGSICLGLVIGISLGYLGASYLLP